MVYNGYNNSNNNGYNDYNIPIFHGIYPAWSTVPENELENHRDINGKIHYFDWVIFNS